MATVSDWTSSLSSPSGAQRLPNFKDKVPETQRPAGIRVLGNVFHDLIHPHAVEVELYCAKSHSKEESP